MNEAPNYMVERDSIEPLTRNWRQSLSLEEFLIEFLMASFTLLGIFCDEVIRAIFIEQLPANCRAILAMSETSDLAKLAIIADRIVDVGGWSSTAVASVDRRDDLNSKIDELTSRIESLSIETHRESRNYNRDHSRSRSRYRSMSRNPNENNNKKKPGNKNDNDKKCFYHKKFGNDALKCRPPCSFKKN
ncbi:uncharacterized protein LOC122503899 [Leptopilina heterotoma]|uniref:uncharacterized protein LOC122503899 n=1 Tax=Leptopilina heterotoma TaxID=63436 RepID=UPI001CA955EB|nr:uncharacterized protein LOC122503899 [Leptopilina heterotoma]